jgi:hypothetical protein
MELTNKKQKLTKFDKARKKILARYEDALENATDAEIYEETKDTGYIDACYMDNETYNAFVYFNSEYLKRLEGGFYNASRKQLKLEV